MYICLENELIGKRQNVPSVTYGINHIHTFNELYNVVSSLNY